MVARKSRVLRRSVYCCLWSVDWVFWNKGIMESGCRAKTCKCCGMQKVLKNLPSQSSKNISPLSSHRQCRDTQNIPKTLGQTNQYSRNLPDSTVPCFTSQCLFHFDIISVTVRKNPSAKLSDIMLLNIKTKQKLAQEKQKQPASLLAINVLISAGCLLHIWRPPH